MYFLIDKCCLLILLSLLCCSNGCLQTIKVYEGTFKVQSIDESCKDFSFIKCNYVSYPQDSWDEATQYQYQSWDKCLDKICFTSNKPQTYETLIECKRHRDQYDKKQQFINGFSLIWIVIGLHLIGSVSFYLCLIYHIHNCCRPQYGRQMYNPPPIIQAYFASGQEIHRLQALQQRQYLQQLQQVICPICFEAKVSVKLNCNHYTHIQCLSNWLKTNVTCPTGRQRIQTIYLLCKTCRRKYYRLYVQRVKNCLEEYCRTCRDCPIG